MDNGETYTGANGKKYKRYHVQANKGADNPTLKQMAEVDGKFVGMRCAGSLALIQAITFIR